MTHRTGGVISWLPQRIVRVTEAAPEQLVGGPSVGRCGAANRQATRRGLTRPQFAGIVTIGAADDGAVCASAIRFCTTLNANFESKSLLEIQYCVSP